MKRKQKKMFLVPGSGKAFGQKWLIMSMLLGIFVLAAALPAFSQGSAKLTGTVRDQAGAPIPGVTVLLKGASQGTISNNEGVYTLQVNQSSGTLVFSFIGMKREEATFNGSATIDVVLQSTSVDLEEIVAVGYGTQRLKNVTCAIGTVNTKDITDLSTGNLASALQGTVN